MTRKKCAHCRIVKCFEKGMRRDWKMNDFERLKRQGNTINERDKQKLPKRHRRRCDSMSVTGHSLEFSISESSPPNKNEVSSSSYKHRHSPKGQDKLSQVSGLSVLLDDDIEILPSSQVLNFGNEQTSNFQRASQKNYVRHENYQQWSHLNKRKAETQHEKKIKFYRPWED